MAHQLADHFPVDSMTLKDLEDQLAAAEALEGLTKKGNLQLDPSARQKAESGAWWASKEMGPVVDRGPSSSTPTRKTSDQGAQEATAFRWLVYVLSTPTRIRPTRYMPIPRQWSDANGGANASFIVTCFAGAVIDGLQAGQVASGVDIGVRGRHAGRSSRSIGPHPETRPQKYDCLAEPEAAGGRGCSCGSRAPAQAKYNRISYKPVYKSGVFSMA